MRQPKPFFRKFTQTWYVTLNGRQHNLGPDKELAYQEYFELMARRGQAVASYTKVAELLDAYLDWLGEQRSQGTYDKAVHYLSHFIRFTGKGLEVRSLEPIRLVLWVESTDWSDTTRHDAISIVQRAFNWAVRCGHIATTGKHVAVVGKAKVDEFYGHSVGD